MEHLQIISDIQHKKIKPVYLLHGPENYFIDEITKTLENIITPDEKAFNFSTFYGKDVDVTNLINACQRFPMMAPYQLIILKEAQYLKNIDDLKHYVQNPVPTTVLVIVHKEKNADKRKTFYKEISKQGVVFESKQMYENQIPNFIDGLVRSRNKSIDLKSSQLLVEFIGNDLTKMMHEIDKLLITLPEGKNTITPAHIEKNIGYSKDYNVFELQNAIGKKDILKANRIANYLAGNPKHSINEVIPLLFSYFQKVLKIHYLKDLSKGSVAATLGINPFFASEFIAVSKMYNIRKTVQVIELLNEYDLKSKGVGYSGSQSDELIKELIFKILH
ncbi:MAG: DNA polymerase III subunit delta [Bacteroidales bacterium]|nr:DNA polymerase III subunit delta [Bacteroidales bacterium]